MQKSKHSWGGRNGSLKRCALAALLILTLPVSCCRSPVTTIPPPEAVLAICQDGNATQVRAWNRVVALAELKGDPHEIKPGVLWAGNHLTRCLRDSP